MKLSIIVPTYNSASYISNLLDGYNGRGNKEVELIVVDDGSTDDTCAIVEKYKPDKLIRCEHKGVSAARNAGMMAAHGDYVWFVDSDDRLPVSGIKHVLAQCNGKENIVAFNHYRYYKKINRTRLRYERYACRYYFHNRPYLWEVVWDRIYKRQFLLDNKISFIEGLNFGEDEMFNLEALNANDGMLQDKHAVYIKTFHNTGSICHNLTPEMKLQVFDELEKLKKKYKKDKRMCYEIDFTAWRQKRLKVFEEVA